MTGEAWVQYEDVTVERESRSASFGRRPGGIGWDSARTREIGNVRRVSASSPGVLLLHMALERGHHPEDVPSLVGLVAAEQEMRDRELEERVAWGQRYTAAARQREALEASRRQIGGHYSATGTWDPRKR